MTTSAPKLRIETEPETDGRWIAEIPELPGVMCYAATKLEAVARVKALALRVIADRFEHAEDSPVIADMFLTAE